MDSDTRSDQPPGEALPRPVPPDISGRRRGADPVEDGLLFAHEYISDTLRYTLDAVTWAFALGEMLVERGLLDPGEFAERRERIGQELQREMQSGSGLFLNHTAEDKYTFAGGVEINCAERVHLCKAACCTFRFPLSKQDLEEGAVRWDLGWPYWNRQDDNGYCTHCDVAKGYACRVYEQRPVPCRTFDCRNDPRIWQDFEAMIPNPNLAEDMERRRLRGGVDWGQVSPQQQ